MINVEILSKVKPGGNSYSSRTASSFKQVSSNSGGGSTSFTPRVLWGQRFDGTQDVYGDMTIRGRIDECTGLAVSGNAGIGGSLTVDGSIYRAGYTVFDQGNSGVGHGWVQLYPKKEYFLSTNQFGEVTDYVRFLDRIRVDKGISTSVIDASQGNFRNITAYEITTDYLTVTKKAHFFSLVIDEVKAVGGQLIVTPARAKIDLVEERAGGGWRCYFRAEDPDGNKIHNEFEKDDQIICQTFNAAVGISYNVSNTYWWRLCTGVSSTPVPREIDGKLYDCHWFDVSGTDCDYRSDAPAAGDECVLLCNRTDTDRQDAIIISAYRNQYLDPSILSPSWCQYTGIDDYDLSSHRLTWFSKSGNTIRGNLIIEGAGMTIEDYIESIFKPIDPSVPNSGTYTHFAYSNGPSINDWTPDDSRSGEGWTHLGIYAGDEEDESKLNFYSYRWSKLQGDSVSDIKEYYMRTEAGVQTPSLDDSRWVLNNPPELTETYRWLWNYEEFIFSSTSIKTSPRVIGVFGSGRGISYIDNYYMISAASSGVSVDDSGWTLSTAQAPTAQKPYLWNYEVIHYTDGSVQTLDPHIISVFSDIEDISIGFNPTYRMLDAGSAAGVTESDILELRVAFDLLCISGVNTVRIRPMDSQFPSNIRAEYVIVEGTTENQGGTVQQPASGSYTWVMDTSVNDWTENHPKATNAVVRLYIDNNMVDCFAIPITLQTGHWIDFSKGINSRVQDSSVRIAELDASVKTIDNRYSSFVQDVSQIKGRVSEVEENVDRATQMIADVSGSMANLRLLADEIDASVEHFREWFDENGDIVDSLSEISSITQRCDRIESSVYVLENDISVQSSTITQLSDRITSSVTDASNRMSRIEQTVSDISMGVTDADLKRTGIDITAGKITISADRTEWIGDIYIKAPSASSTQGLTLYNYAGDRSVQVRNDSLGSLNDYSFTGARQGSLEKSGTKSGSPFTVSFSRASLGRGVRRNAGETVTLWDIVFNIGPNDSVSSPEWQLTDISSVAATIAIVNSSGTVRKSASQTVYTQSNFTRSWRGWVFSEIEYTVSTSEVLYVEMSFTVTCSGGAASATRYTAGANYMEYVNVTSLNKLAIDTAVFSQSDEEYFWAGNMKWPNRTDEFGIMLRNKQHGIAVTPIGVYRPYNEGNSQSDSYPGVFSNWGDISSTTPCMQSSQSNVDLSSTSWYYSMFGVVTLNAPQGTKQTVTLPDPFKCPGKWFIIKRITPAGTWDTTVKCAASGSVFMDCDDTQVHSSYGIANRASWFYSTGSKWLHFHIGNWESDAVAHD